MFSFGLQVGAADVELERAQDLGETAHADPADPDEVHVAHASAEHQCAPPPLPLRSRRGGSRGGRSAMRAEARGGLRDATRGVGSAARAARVGHGATGHVVGEEAADLARPGAPRRPRSCSTQTAAPARASASAFRAWWSSAAWGKGTRSDARPMAVISAIVAGAGPGDHEVGVGDGLRPRRR